MFLGYWQWPNDVCCVELWTTSITFPYTGIYKFNQYIVISIHSNKYKMSHLDSKWRTSYSVGGICGGTRFSRESHLEAMFEAFPCWCWQRWRECATPPSGVHSSAVFGECIINSVYLYYIYIIISITTHSLQTNTASRHGYSKLCYHNIQTML